MLRGPDRSPRPVLVLAMILAAATLLRVAQLGSKALWLDEAMTVLIALGRGPDAVPIGSVRPLASVDEIFTAPRPVAIATVVGRLRDPAVQHTHPPLYYVVAHAWLSLGAPSPAWLAWWSRLLSVLFGVAAVLLIFLLGRAAVSTRVGIVAAALTAVSPLMVMIAQEARNYTLPLVCVALACLVAVSIVDRLSGDDEGPHWSLWVAWIAVNLLGCYAHYYVLLSVAAQVLTLAVMMRRRESRSAYVALALATVAIAIGFLPWAPTFAAHARSPEQVWMREANPLVYVYHTLRAWQAMVQGWPVDAPQPHLPWLVARIAVGVLVLAIFVARIATTVHDEGRPPLEALLMLSVLTIAGLWAASAVQQKDLTGEFRFHFVYYPAVVVVLAAVLASLRPWLTVAVLALGAANSVLLVDGREFPKPTRPREVAAIVARGTSESSLLVIGEASFHETVVGLTYLRELARQRRGGEPDTQFLFVRRSDRYPTFVAGDADPDTFWREFLASNPPLPPTVWMWQAASPPPAYRTAFISKTTPIFPNPGWTTTCTLDVRDVHRTLTDDDGPLGPFRLYRCVKEVQ